MFSYLFKSLILLLILIENIASYPTFDTNASGRELLRLAKSSEIHNYMNESADPCEDFYEFACGNFRRINPNPTKPYEKSIFSIMKKDLETKIIKYLSNTDETDTPLDRTVKSFYGSCVHFVTQERKYKNKLKQIVNEFGKMPVLEEDDENKKEKEFDWIQVIGEIANKYDIKMLISSKIDTKEHENVLNLFISDLSFPSIQMYTEEEYEDYRNASRRRMEINMRIFLGIEKRLAKETAKEIFEFEKEFAIATKTKRGYLSRTYQPYIIDELQYKYAPDINVMNLLTLIFGKIPSGTIYDLIEGDPENIRVVLKKTSHRILANYIFYNLLKHFMLNARDYPTTCLLKTKEYFPQYIENMTFRKFFNHQTVKDVEVLWNLLKSTMENDLNSSKLEWIKAENRESTLSKLINAKLEFNVHEHTNFSQEFGVLTLDKHDYVGNLKAIFALKASKAKKLANQFRKAVRNTQTTEELKIIVPLSILQPYYLWSNSYPHASKYGTLGILLSHELIRLLNPANSNKAFEQFKLSSLDKIHYNQQPLAHSDNFPDNEAIRLAFGAYQKWIEDFTQNQGNELMPRLDFTSKQLFFISYGQMLCSDSLEFIESYFGLAEYIIDKDRINVPLTNYEEFSKEFKCSSGSAMNPRKECENYDLS